MSFLDARRPALPFALAVAGSALATAAIATAIASYGGIEVIAAGAPGLFLGIFLVAILVIAAIAALVGLPLTWLLARTRSEEPWVYPAAGLFAGGGLMIASQKLLYPLAGTVPERLLHTAPIGAVPGFVCGALWWSLYRRHMRAAEAPPAILDEPVANVSKTAVAVALLMVLQVGGCAVVGWDHSVLPLLCTAAAPRLDWLGYTQALLLIGYLPFALAALAVPRLRLLAIAVGGLALASLALQHVLLARGVFTCDSF